MVAPKFNQQRFYEIHAHSLDDSCSSFDVDEEISIKRGLETTSLPPLKKSRERRQVSFRDMASVYPIPNANELSEEQFFSYFMSKEEHFAIRSEARELLHKKNAGKLTEEEEEQLRGLETYTKTGREEAASRRRRAANAVFRLQKDGRSAEWIATSYRDATKESASIAHRLGLMEQQRAWPTDNQMSARLAPLVQTMIR